ncbi:peptide ABC transporter ATP-binding protein [Devosia sp. Root685]|uniref:ABC transporter ATP-binding protein n=1 Tax=Devosia sp. Root685 TaxID=1736587 RepID=UPI0006F5A38D|nr:ABC transporter ATP-binding protein [Devosia sp. Root685]KRA97916.1 peptide ABC transporter ATP-binding protein [Devosia sp. Root685]
MTENLLTIRDLQVAFGSGEGTIQALRGVDITLRRGECLGLVGESGSGKSLTALAAMRLLPGAARVNAGSIEFEGREMTTATRAELEQVRGNDISMIFQEPMTALNPVMRVGDQIAAPLRKHLGLSAKAARARAIEQLESVGIPDPQRRIDNFPHEMSGGMRQRVMIAMALACEPKLLIADEPTTALDVTIQAQILDLLRAKQKELGLAIIIITHDFGVVAEIADRVNVMYGGRVVEKAEVGTLFDNPQHPYSIGLHNATPTLEMPEQRRLPAIGGAVPHISEMPSGCAFHPRCPERRPECDTSVPQLLPISADQSVACWARRQANDQAA